MKLDLKNVTLIGVDCVDLKGLQLAADISTKDISFGAVKLLSSIKSDDLRVIQIPHINSTKKYSEFMIRELYKYVDTEFALVFQADGFVLNSLAWSPSFLQYDYIGGPWYHLGDLRVGNGGFSLRSKKLINWLGYNWKSIKAHIHPEDIYISKFARPYLEQNGMKFALEEVALKFSIDGDQRSNVWNGQFGFHGFGWTDISNWLINHPEYKSQLTYELGDYFNIMKKYPIYDGTVHTFRFKIQNIKNYIQISKNEKNYETRLIDNKCFEFDNIKVGDNIIFKKSGSKTKHILTPSFERKIKNIEYFQSFNDLRKVYPKMHVTYPLRNISKWKKSFTKILGDSIYPKNNTYGVFWLD